VDILMIMDKETFGNLSKNDKTFFYIDRAQIDKKSTNKFRKSFSYSFLLIIVYIVCLH